jgi:hypothetical protein
MEMLFYRGYMGGKTYTDLVKKTMRVFSKIIIFRLF